MELPEETVKHLKRKKKHKDKKRRQETKSEGDHPDMSHQDLAVLITDSEVISKQKKAKQTKKALRRLQKRAAFAVAEKTSCSPSPKKKMKVTFEEPAEQE